MCPAASKERNAGERSSRSGKASAIGLPLLSARLLVDGVERLSGYRGHSEYVEDWGLFLATSIYRSTTAEGRFKRVRFEINQ